VKQGEIGQSSGAHNNISNPDPEMPTKPDKTMGPRHSQEYEEVLVEDINDRPKSKREEEDIDATEARTTPMKQKRKA